MNETGITGSILKVLQTALENATSHQEIVSITDRIITLLDLRRSNLWNVEQAAEYIGVRPNTLRDWIHRESVPYIKIEGSVRFEPKDLQQFISSRKIAMNRLRVKLPIKKRPA